MLTERLTDLTVLRGDSVPQKAEICVVVMSVDSEPHTGAAIASILCQDVQAEIVVVNTGAGSLRSSLTPFLPWVVFAETPTRQFAGGARNIGIRLSTAPIVSFLAADCVVPPSWLRQRLETHASGHQAVASCVIPTCTSPLAWASCIVTHFRRMPSISPESASLCGLSYARSLFDRVGLFDETLRIGEDSEFNERIEQLATPIWRPDIVTEHRYPDGLASSIIDQYRRGRRSAIRASRSPVGFSAARLKWNVSNLALIYRHRTRFGDIPVRSLPLAFVLAVSQSIGIASAITSR